MQSYARYLNNIPINPSVAAKVLGMVEKQDFSFNSLEEVIRADAALTSKILRIANSALYARQNKVTKLQNAITILGTNTIKNLVILVTGASLFQKNWNSPFYSFFWRHSLATAFIAKNLSIRTNNNIYAEEAFVAGLLHNIGQVALFAHDPVKYEELLQTSVLEDRRISELELEQFGTTHKEVGHEVLSGWTFPEVYSDTALEHGNNNITSTHKHVVVIVSVADFLSSNWFVLEANPKPISLLENYLTFLSISEQELDQYQTEYRALLQKDAMYIEFQNLVKE